MGDWVNANRQVVRFVLKMRAHRICTCELPSKDRLYIGGKHQECIYNPPHGLGYARQWEGAVMRPCKRTRHCSEAQNCPLNPLFSRHASGASLAGSGGNGVGRRFENEI